MSDNLLKKTTLKEIAAHAGVSLATVDRVVSKRAPVSPHTRERVLAAINELKNENGSSGVNNTQTQKKVSYGFVMESGVAFINSIEKIIASLQDHYRELGITLNIYSSSTLDTNKFLQLLKKAAKCNDGLIILARELPGISSAVNKVIAGGIPAVCFTSDISDTARLGYIGINNFSAGRAAGSLMGNYLRQQTGDVVLVVSAPFRSQYERELGFRQILRERFPNLRICESLNNHELDEDGYKSLMALFESGVKPLGVYCVTGGTSGIAKAIKNMGWTSDIVFITHELNESSHSLLTDNDIDIVIDQDLRSEITDAINALLHHHKIIHQKTVFTPKPPLIITPENIVTRAAVTTPHINKIAEEIIG